VEFFKLFKKLAFALEDCILALSNRMTGLMLSLGVDTGVSLNSSKMVISVFLVLTNYGDHRRKHP
jgi:hypothetical protein